MATFTNEQIRAHIAARLSRISPDRVLPDMRQEAEMNKCVLELALSALEEPQCGHVNMDCDDGQARCLGCGKVWEV